MSESPASNVSVSASVTASRTAGSNAVDELDPQQAIEYCYGQAWTDGLPVVPCTTALVEEFLDRVECEPDDVVFRIPHLNRACSVRLAAINAAMAGCLPDYFPVVLSTWRSLQAEGYASKGVWQSTTGAATFIVVNGPIQEQIGLNSKGNVFGSGFRANATIGRAIRLTAMNVFDSKPGILDQSTQGTPAKYTCCIGENEADSPWPGLHEQFGYQAQQSTTTAMTMRSSMHIEARHTSEPEQLLRDISDTVARTGSLVQETISCAVVLCPEHAHLLADGGWDKPMVRQFVFEQAVRSRAALDRVGKGAVSRHARWRVPRDHPDAVADENTDRDGLHVLTRPEAVAVLVSGAWNSGVSTVIETFGPRGNQPPITKVEERHV
jgi:hypothetical protein